MPTTAETIAQVANGPVPVLAATNVATSNFSGPEVAGLSALLNIIIQPVKQYSWFKQDRVAVYVLLLLGLVLAFLVVYLTTHDVGQSIAQGLLKGGSAAWQATVNYGTLGPKGLDYFKAGT